MAEKRGGNGVAFAEAAFAEYTTVEWLPALSGLATPAAWLGASIVAIFAMIGFDRVGLT